MIHNTGAIFTKDLQHSPVLSGVEIPYQDKVLSYGPIAYWILNDDVGSAVALDYSGNGLNGNAISVTYGVTGIGDGNTAAQFAGGSPSDRINVYSAGLNALFDRDEFTIQMWLNPSNWNTATGEWPLVLLTDGSNFIGIYKINVAYNLRIRRVGNATSAQQTTAVPSGGWFHVAMTASVTTNELKMYLNGSQVLPTANGVVGWVGNLNANECALGAGNGAGTYQPYVGTMAHIALWSSALSDDVIADLASA